MAYSPHSVAIDYSLSGFGTIQYSVGDNDANYLRFINQEGTLKVNSVVGAQLDAQFNPQWSATVQYVVAPKLTRDEGVALDNRWAFLKYRPNDHWDFRLGRQRLNFYLDSENLDVGQTYVQANLNPELYFNPGVLGVDGFSANYATEDQAGRYWRIQAIAGQRKIVQRQGPGNGAFPRNDFDLFGGSAQVDGDDYRLQLAYHKADVTRAVSRFMGVNVDGKIAVSAEFTNLSMEKDWRSYTLRAELSHVRFDGFAQAFVPALGVSIFDDPAPVSENLGNLVLIRKLDNGHAVYGSYGRVLAEVDDQYSFAVGGRYSLSPSQSVKLELMHIREKDPRPQLSDNRRPNNTLNILSVNYNWVWQ